MTYNKKSSLNDMHQFTQGIASQNKNNDDSILIVPC